MSRSRPILELLRSIVRDRGMALLLITHDLGVVQELCERAVVLYAGRVAEQAAVAGLLGDPWHPYTAGLGASTPSIAVRRRRLPQISGMPPDPSALPPGCAFAARCPAAVDVCRSLEPPLTELAPGRRSACHRSAELRDHTLDLEWSAR